MGLGTAPAWSTASPAQAGKMAAHKGLDHGQERQCSGSGEDSMMARRIRGGLDDGTDSGEVDDSAGSRENFDRKIWQPDVVSESLRGFEFAKAVQRFIYWGTTVTMGISDVIMAIATVMINLLLM
jgi:hypothetical protein